MYYTMQYTSVSPSTILTVTIRMLLFEFDCVENNSKEKTQTGEDFLDFARYDPSDFAELVDAVCSFHIC